MPIQRCKIGGKRGWRWGEHGKCYTGANGLSRAKRQMRAILATGWTENAHTGTLPLNPLRADPTRLVTLRRRYTAEVRGRFLKLQDAIEKLIVGDDAFGMTANKRWKALSTTEQLNAFEAWLAQRINADILLGASGTEQAYWQAFSREAYEKGKLRAIAEGKPIPAGPVPVEKLKRMASRQFTDLQGITKEMSSQVGQVLTEGLARGDSKEAIARAINDRVSKIGMTRAEILVETELTRVHAEAQLDALEEMGYDEVGVMAEWHTRHDGKVCDECAPLDRIVLRISEARGLLPRHPRCRCAFSIANIKKFKKGQKRTQTAIRKAIDKSIAAEIPKPKKGKKPRSLKTQKKLSPWVGAGKTLKGGIANYDPSQPRDQEGKWTSGGAGGPTRLEAYTESVSVKRAEEHHAALVSIMGAKPGEDVNVKLKRLVTNELGEALRKSGLDSSEARALAAAAGGVRTADPYKDLAATMVNSWAETSGDHDTVALAIQDMAGFIFKPDDAADPVATYKSSKRLEVDVFLSEHQNAVGTFLEETYKNTQKQLKEAGIEEVLVYRGGDFDLTDGNKTVQMNPLSSFSTERKVAENFGATVLVMRVPREKIFSIPSSGPGCHYEKEVIVLGGVHEVEVTHVEE